MTAASPARAGRGRLVELLRRANADPPPEHSRALRATVLVAVMASALGVLRAGIGGPLLVTAVVVGVPAGFVWSYAARHRTGYGRKVAVAALSTAVLGRFLAEAVGVPLEALSQLRVPLAELFLWVQVLHSFDMPARRDLLVSLLASLALVVLGSVLLPTLEFAPHLLVWAGAAAVSLLLAYRSQLDQLPGLLGTHARARPSPTVRPALAALGVVFLAGAATFLALPPTGAGRVIALPALRTSGPVPNPGGISNPSLGSLDPATARRGRPAAPMARFGYLGFSDHMDTAARGRPDDTVVMRVRAGQPDFWRGQTFDVWDGRSWTLTRERPGVLRGPAPLHLVPSGEDLFAQYLGEQFVQTYFVARPGPNLFFGAYKVDRLYLPVDTVDTLSDGTIRAREHLGKGTVYSVVSRRRPVTATMLRRSPPSAPRLPPGFVDRYTQLPDVPARVRELAARVTAEAPTTYDKVLALERWMADNTTYTLDIPPLPEGADAVEQFLFADRKGFCEQIGTSLVVMLRSLGVPARLAVGYTPGKRNPFTGLYEVRARDAHAWAEVYFPGVGWQGFDPTASVPLSGEAPAESTARLLAAFLGDRLPSPPAWAPGAAAAAVAGGVAAGLARRAWARGRRRRTAPAPTWGEVYLDRLERVGAARGRARRPNETTREYVD
ncbi:MAG TPA: transglutaminaseTgpA domain-containing protein, partial [Acidimicrobiales bacterium]|nr:transglutaminaseTgpA domain-containing protein [Acidimicrobiales bacterium]